jgi:hypothetical protein
MMGGKLSFLDNILQSALLFVGAAWVFFEANMQTFTALGLFIAAVCKAYLSVREIFHQRKDK